MKTENNTYDIYYDKEADFLEIFFGEPSKCLTEEMQEGVFIRRDENTNEIKSIGILSFKKRVGVLKQILQKVNIDFPLEISI